MSDRVIPLQVVTASTNLVRARACLESWGGVPIHVILNGGATFDEETRFAFPAMTVTTVKDYLGVVPAFRLGVDYALGAGAEIIACLHDDVRIDDIDWSARVYGAFQDNPKIGLLGFGGALGVGDDDLYQTPYKPEQLARKHFRSNLSDAETHGIRSLRRERVACLDGFSLIGRREFFQGYRFGGREDDPPFAHLADLGMIHHAYDGAMGCHAARLGWETWYLPIACHHYGGQTAVGDPGYQRWADRQRSGGDRGFWLEAHKLWYEEYRDVLPLRVDGGRR